MAQGVAKLGQSVETLLKRHGKGIIGEQLSTKRVADACVDLFVGLCVLSRVSAMITERGETQCATEIAMVKVYAQFARTRIANSLRALSKNEDRALLSLADSVIGKGSYTWDIL
jgi:hypothetical protein